MLDEVLFFATPVAGLKSAKKQMKREILLLMLFGWVVTASASPVCTLQAVQNHGNFITVPGYKIELLGPGSPTNPTGWDTGLTVTDAAGKSCTMQDAIISAPFYLAGDHILYLSLTSDSTDFLLDAVDLRSCANPWTSKRNFDPPHLIDHAGGFAFGHAETDLLGASCLPARKAGQP